MSGKIRLGMVGGGPDSFIGTIHRSAAVLDGAMELVCGAFSGNPDKSKKMGQELFLEKERSYGSFEEMFQQEAQRPVDSRMEAVSIVTPNHLHFKPAMLALENGFHVICDKPLCLSMEEALQLKTRAEETDLIFALTYTYTGYPMVKEAKVRVQNGSIGKIRKIVVQYPQGWLTTPLEKENQKQATWRTDPRRSGQGGTIGDIGTHAANLVSYVTGLKIQRLNAALYTHVDGRKLDDDATVLMELENEAKCLLLASQISAGEENNLSLQVYGTLGSISWCHKDCQSLTLNWLNKSNETLRAGVDSRYLSDLALRHCRLPSGHPEGYLEAFANIYRNVAKCIEGKRDNTEIEPHYLDYPNIDDGVAGMQFIQRVVESSTSDKKWIDFKN